MTHAISTHLSGQPHSLQVRLSFLRDRWPLLLCHPSLPPELFCLGRCPACVDYDGPPSIHRNIWPPEDSTPLRTEMRLEDFAALEHVTARQWGPFSPFSDAQIETAQVEIMLSRQLLRQVSVMEHRIDHIVDFAQGMRHELNNRGVTNSDIRRLERWAELISARRITFARAAQAAHIAGLRPLHTPLSHELMRPTHDAPDTNWEAHHHRQYRFGRNSFTTPCTFSRPLLFLGEDYGDTDDVEDFASPSLRASEPYVADCPVESMPTIGPHSAGFLRQEVHEFTSVTSLLPAHRGCAAAARTTLLGQLAWTLATLRVTSDKEARSSLLDGIARLYDVQPSVASRTAIALVVVCLDSPSAHVRPLPPRVSCVPFADLHAWYVRLAVCPEISAAVALCSLGIGRAYSSDSMGDGPMMRAAALPALPSSPILPLSLAFFAIMHTLGIGRAYSSDSMGDGPGRYSAALRAASSAPPPSSLFSPSILPSSSFSSSLPMAPPQHSFAPADAHARLPPAPQPMSGHAAPLLSRMQTARLQTARPRRTDGPPVMPAVMQTAVADGQRFAAAPDRHRLVSKRKRAMLQFAHERAAAMASSSTTHEQLEHLQMAVLATHELAEYGSAVGTLDKDDRAWEFWDRFCKLYGWEPVITAEFARLHPMEISQRLAIFQAWVYPQLKGVKQADAKPRSVFNGYVLAIIRILDREHVPMPKAKHVEKSLNGIMRAFKDIYGHEALMPGRKQPFTPAMWARIEGLPEGTPLAGRPNWSPAHRHRDRNLLRLGRVLWSTGHRLGEIVWHPSGQVHYTTRACVSISKADGSKIAVPTAADWRAFSPGDCIMLAPCTSKSDQFGEEHCPFPSILPYDGDDSSAAASIRDIELESPCPPHMRRKTPLFADEQGHPFSYSMLHGDLRSLLDALFGRAYSLAFSWHSVRIGLACALHAADCPDPVIQLICRWASPDSLKVYRQMGIEKNVYWVARAHSVTFDATRVNNLPALDNSDSMLDQQQAFGMLVASPDMPATPVRRPVRSFAVPGGAVQAFAADVHGIVGLSVSVPRSFWRVEDLKGDEPARITCTVAGECVREFLHPDGVRTCTYLLSCGEQYFPIKRDSLVRVCMTSAQRLQLGI
jgi:hypothetical protein